MASEERSQADKGEGKEGEEDEEKDEGPPMSEALGPRDHAREFNPRHYLECFYISAHEDSAMETILFFLPGLALQVPSGGALLDVGSGPTVHVPLAFRNRVDSFFLSDFAPANREFLRRWWHKEASGEETFDWSKVVKWMETLEMSAGSAATMEDVARSKVRAILGCDVHTRRLFFSQTPEDEAVPALFDVVTCIFCLEYASLSEKDYRDAVANIARKVKPGGYLIMGGIFNEGSYYFGGKRFLSYRLREDVLEDALRAAGFPHRTLHQDPNGPLAYKLIVSGGVFIVLSRKPLAGEDLYQ